MMMKPAVPKPTAEYMAAKRAECKKASPCDDDEAKEAMREQAPFWMSQASLAYSVPNTCEDIGTVITLKAGITQDSLKYNGVSFDASPLEYVNMMNSGRPAKGADPRPETFPGKYLAMGSFFNNSQNDPPSVKLDVTKRHEVVGRYFLVEVTDPKGYSIPNPDSCLINKDMCVAPAGSFILSFSGTEVDAQLFGLFKQDFDWQPGTLPLLPEYEGYQKMIEAQNTMFEGTGPCAEKTNPMVGVTKALETPESDTSNPRLPYGGAGFVCKGQGSDDDDVKQITIVGHSLGGAHAQLAAVQIAHQYKAKVRVITFESILAFTPEGAKKVVEDFIVGPDGIPDVSGKAEPTVKFPPEVGQITAQRWVEDDSPMTAAPLLLPAGGCCPFPILNIFNPFNWCFGPPACSGTWKDKYRLVGCWPCNGNLGNGYISRALIMRGFQAGLGTPSLGMFGCCPKGGGRLLCRRCCKDTLQYQDDQFVLDISDERTYTTTGASRLPLPINFGGWFRLTNHFQPFLLWMLYKGAYQNDKAPDSSLTPGQKVSQYVPKVYGPAPCHA